MAGRSDLPVPSPVEVVGVGFSAAARRLDPLATKGEDALGPEPERHREAWTAYDEIPEVGTLVSGSASLLSQCRLYVGFTDESGEEQRLRDEDGIVVEGFTPQFVADAEATLARFVDQGGSQRGLLLSQAENFDVTGDSYMVGWLIGDDGAPWEGPDDRAVGERWEIVSRGALARASGRWTIQLGGDRSVKLPASAIVYRMWRKHPRRPDDSRGWVLAALDVCRDLRVFTLAQRSAARSSIPASILVTAQEASPKNLTPPGAPAGGTVPPQMTGAVMLGGVQGVGPGTPPAQPMTWAQTLERLIGDAVMEVLRDAQSGRAVVPAVLAVAERYVNSFEQIDLSRTIDSALAELVMQARSRLAQSADCPPEMLTGLGETNRWNGAQIADDEYRRYFKPKAMTIADAWTVELLWGGLRELGYSEDELRRVRVLVDARGVVAEPDRSKLATEGLRLAAISWAAWREACGFSESDAPDEAEQQQLIELFGKQPPQQLGSPEVNRQVGSARSVELTATLDTTDEQSIELVALPAARPLPAISSLRTRSAASTRQAALSPVELAEQLLAIEQTTRTRVEEACEAALDQALSRGGAKLKTWARRDHDLRALLAAVDARDVPATLGPERARRVAREQFADDDRARREDLFAAALAALLLSFGRITRSAYERAARLLGVQIIEAGETAAAGVPVLSAAEVERNIEAGASVLRESMMELADRRIFDPIAEPPIGELSNLQTPSPVVRRSLGAAGGAPVEPGLDGDPDAVRGLAFGPTLGEHEPAAMAWEWVYGEEARMRPYEPHVEIDGQVFSGPDDPALSGIAPGGGAGYPGDHYGCRCDWIPVFAETSEG